MSFKHVPSHRRRYRREQLFILPDWDRFAVDRFDHRCKLLSMRCWQLQRILWRVVCPMPYRDVQPELWLVFVRAVPAWNLFCSCWHDLAVSLHAMSSREVQFKSRSSSLHALRTRIVHTSIRKLELHRKPHWQLRSAVWQLHVVDVSYWHDDEDPWTSNVCAQRGMQSWNVCHTKLALRAVPSRAVQHHDGCVLVRALHRWDLQLDNASQLGQHVHPVPSRNVQQPRGRARHRSLPAVSCRDIQPFTRRIGRRCL